MAKILSLPDGKNLTLRRATPEDAEAIWQLYHRVYGGSYTLPIINLRAKREEALQDPDCYWLVCEAEPGLIVGSVIFLVDAGNRNAKVFAAAVDDEYRRGHVAFELIEAGIQKLMYESRIVDAIYATTRTRTMGPDNLLKKLGFMSLGIFPNVHRLATYETHGLKALFHPEAFATRRKLPQLIPEVAGFYETIRKSYGLEPAEIVPIEDRLKLRIVSDPAQVKEEYDRCRESQALLLDFFPFHPPTHLLTSDQGHVKAFLNREGKDGHAVVVGLQVARVAVQHLEHIFNVVFETAQTMGIDYLELLISAYEPKQQRAALSAKFLPCAYFPAMRQTALAREDILVFARSILPLDFSHVQMTPRDRRFLDVYLLNTEFRNLVVQMQEAPGGSLEPAVE
ncbi:MAG: N-acetyltransferase family protein [Candidatus Sericytochromatia bacterium]